MNKVARSILDRLSKEPIESVIQSELKIEDRILSDNLAVSPRGFVVIRNDDVFFFFEDGYEWISDYLGKAEIHLPLHIGHKRASRLSRLLPGVRIKLEPDPEITQFHDFFFSRIDTLLY